MDELRDRLAADLVLDPHAHGLIADALRLAGDEPEAAVALLVLRLRQGRPSDDALRTALRRAGLVLERGRIGG
jgi:hypothetical protein